MREPQSEETRRPPKKSEMLEVRLDHETKQNFLDACRRAGRTASDVVREAVNDFILADRERSDPEPGHGRLTAMIPRPIRKKRYLAAAAGLAGIAAIAVLPSAADPTLQAAFGKIDSNGDGVLAPDEFFRGQLEADAVEERRRESRRGQPAPEPGALRVRQEPYVFIFPRREGDPAGDWGMSMTISTEFDNVPENFDVAKVDPALLQPQGAMAAFFVDADANADGAISYAEFETQFNALLAKSFNRVDREGDGYLTPNEFLRFAGWIRATSNDGTPGDELPDELMTDGFSRLDANADGRLSLAEYMMQ